MSIQGEDIKRLIPQREPFIMVDSFSTTTDGAALTALTVSHGNYFLQGGQLAETGLIEHIAQSAAALAGYQGQQQGEPRIGLIGEVKRFECLRKPSLGEKVQTTVRFGFSMGNVTLATGECHVGEETIATAQLKIFMQ